MKALLFVFVGVALAGIVGAIISRRKKEEEDRKRAREDAVSGANVTNDITRVGPGGVLKMPPFGKNRLPIETYVKTRHRYQDPEGGKPWYELVCEHGRREMVVEWSREGGEVYVTAGYDDEHPSLDDVGLTEEKLIEFDESGRGRFDWDGDTWHLSESGERLYFADDGREDEGFYCWEFESGDESRNLSIEKWAGDHKFYVYVLHNVDARSIEIFDAGQVKR